MLLRAIDFLPLLINPRVFPLDDRSSVCWPAKYLLMLAFLNDPMKDGSV